MSEDRPGPGRELLRQALAGRRSQRPGRHFDDQEIAELLEVGSRHLLPERARHLADCERCRSGWIAAIEGAGELLQPGTLERPPSEAEPTAVGLAGERSARRRSLPLLPPVPAMAALAVLLLAVGIGLLLPAPEGGAPGPRRAADSEPGELQLLRPRGLVDGASNLVFEWSPTTGASMYELVVLDPAAGSEVLIRQRTPDTVHRLAPSHRGALADGREYRWLVRVERGADRFVASLPAAFMLRAGERSAPAETTETPGDGSEGEPGQEAQPATDTPG